jgi:hypothetical protein
MTISKATRQAGGANIRSCERNYQRCLPAGYGDDGDESIERLSAVQSDLVLAMTSSIAMTVVLAEGNRTWLILDVT